MENSLARMAQLLLGRILSHISWTYAFSGLKWSSIGILPIAAESRKYPNSNRRKGQIDERFRPDYDKLVAIRNALERLSLTQAWSLRETDLYSYQRQLDRIDEGRVKYVSSKIKLLFA